MALDHLGGLAKIAPLLAVLFFVPAMNLAGIPPFSGFVAKFALVSAAIEAKQWGIVVVALAVSLLTVYVMGRIWSNVFWGEPEDGVVSDRLQPGATKVPMLMTAATSVVVALSVALLVFAGPLYDLAERAATDLLHPQGYIEAVLGHSDRAEVGG